MGIIEEFQINCQSAGCCWQDRKECQELDLPSPVTSSVSSGWSWSKIFQLCQQIKFDQNYFPTTILMLPTWMEFDLHFSSAPTFLLRPRGRGVSFCSKAECHHSFYIKYIQQAPLSLTCSLEWPLRELSLANYLLFRFYLTLHTMKGQSRAEN